VRALLVIVLAGIASSCRSDPPARANAEAEKPAEAKRDSEVVLNDAAQRMARIVVQAAATETARDMITATGQITYNEDESWMVGSVVDGRVVSVAAKVGDSVKTGQVLAQVHSHEVHDSRADYGNAAEEVARVQAALAQAERVRDRARRLFELKAMSREQLEHAELEYRNTQSSMEKAKTDLEKQRVHLVEFLDVPVAEPAGKGASDQDFVPVKAPAGGVVVERFATAGSAVTAGQQLYRVANLSALWMIANVNEADLANIRTGQAVRVRVRAYPDRKFSGRVLRLGEQLDPATRTLRVHVLVPNQHGLLKPEMFANAEIDRPSSREVVVVPESAIQDMNGHKIVFVRVAPGRFAVRPVQTVPSGAGQAEVVAGLQANEPVVVQGAFVLKSHLLRSSLAEE
jgi:membrane fusion protein, heavy metal efflux system